MPCDHAMPQPLPLIAVAVSGGADSLHTLLTLKDAGYPVFALHGIFGQGLLAEFARHMRGHAVSPDRDPDISATGQQSTEARAADGHTPVAEEAGALPELRAVCRSFGIPLHVADLSTPFVERVVRPFVRAFAEGATPNPCALCNAEIKFGLLLDAALDLRADFLATGHYARLERQGDPEVHPVCAGQLSASAEASSLPPFRFDPAACSGKGSLPALLQGEDTFKDQSYFLALAPVERLARALFPLGPMKKEAVLAALAERGISPPVVEESQEICFIPGNLYREFLPFMAQRLGIALPGEGPMRLPEGTRLDTHRGLWNYTEGQRRGLGVAWSEPLYVLRKDAPSNTLYIGPKPALRCDRLLCAEMNILLPPEEWPAPPEEYGAATPCPASSITRAVWVKTRYRSVPRQALVTLEFPSETGRPSAIVRFHEPDSAVAPGQLCALYIPAGGPMRLVAGGIISSVEGGELFPR